MERRTFLKTIGLGLAAGSVAAGGCGNACAGEPAVPARKPGEPARVALITDASVRKGEGLDSGRVAALLDRALCAALDTKDAASAWKSLLAPDDVVGLKLNCLAGRPLSPNPELVDAFVGSLGKAGIPPTRIVVFERGERDLQKGGFEPGDRGGVQYLGNDSRGAGYEEEPEMSYDVGSCLSRILTRKITALISVGVVKDHSLAGIGGGLKNLYGLIHNPNKYHDNNCDPFVADVLSFPVVQRKLRLTVLDAITAQCHGGPGYVPPHAWPLNGLLLSTDPVACDRVAWDVIETQRKAKGLPTLAAENRVPKWLRTAAARGLGVDDLGKIQIMHGGS